MFTRFFILFLLLLISCGSDKDLKVESAIDQALTYLTSEKCDDALDALKKSEDLKNPIYLQVLSSAYACKANVNSVEVIDELEGLNSTKVLNEISTKSFAQTIDLTEYRFLSQSLDLIFSSTQEVSQKAREEAFGKRKGQDLGMQALLYSVVQISKFVNYFGNTKSGGKGDGDGVNRCFQDYSSAPYLFSLLPATNSCDSDSDGHPELDLDTDLGRKNACESLTLVNNSLDIIESIDFGSSQNLKVIKEISEKIAALRDYIITIDPSLERLFVIRNEASCFDLTDEEKRIFIFSLFEVGFE